MFICMHAFINALITIFDSNNNNNNNKITQTNNIYIYINIYICIIHIIDSVSKTKDGTIRGPVHRLLYAPVKNSPKAVAWVDWLFHEIGKMFIHIHT